MTSPTATRDTSPKDLELGHPVRSFVGVLVLIGVVLLGLQWTGAVQPKLTIMGSGAGVDGGIEYRQVLLHNDGLVPLRVEAMEWPAPGWTDTRIVLLPKDSSPGTFPFLTPSAAEPLEAFTLGRGEGEARRIVLIGRPACPNQPTASTLDVRVRTWLGVERTVTLPSGDGGTGDADSCP